MKKTNTAMEEPRIGLGQSKPMSALESICNTSSGFIIAMLVSAVVYPIYGWQPTVDTMFQLTVIFTVTSVVRSYLFRRLFNWITIRWGK